LDASTILQLHSKIWIENSEPSNPFQKLSLNLILQTISL